MFVGSTGINLPCFKARTLLQTALQPTVAVPNFNASPPAVFLADASSEFLAMLQYALEAIEPKSVFMTTDNQKQAEKLWNGYRHAPQDAPGIAFVGLSLGNNEGHLLIEHIKDCSPDTVTVLLSERPYHQLRREILSAHLRGNLFAFIEKDQVMKHLPQLWEAAFERYKGTGGRFGSGPRLVEEQLPFKLFY